MPCSYLWARCQAVLIGRSVSVVDETLCDHVTEDDPVGNPMDLVQYIAWDTLNENLNFAEWPTWRTEKANSNGVQDGDIISIILYSADLRSST